MTTQAASAELERALTGALDVAERALSSGDQSGASETLLHELHDALYRDWYCGAHAGPVDAGEDRDLAELLRAAHAGTYRWEDGWQVVNVSSLGRVAVRRGRERRILHVIDCAASSQPIEVGDSIAVVSRRDSETINPGDWVTFGDSWPRNREPVVRLYWNALPAGAVALVEATTERLPPDFPFFLKCPRRPHEYGRVDAVVLYLPVPKFAAVAETVARIHAAVRSLLDDAVPPLARRLAPGLGLAEDPPAADESFGTHRSGLVARAVAGCVASGSGDRDRWMAAVLAELAAAGIPLERPWVNSADSPRYELP